MDILFENTTLYSQKELKKFLEFDIKKSKSKNLYIIFLAIAIIYILVYNIFTANWIKLLEIIVLLAVIVSIYKCIIINKKAQNNRENKDKSFTFYFYENQIKIKDNNANKYAIEKYYQIHKVYETKDRFYLYINDDYSFIISKEGFKTGTPATFKKFIKEKCKFKYRRKV